MRDDSSFPPRHGPGEPPFVLFDLSRLLSRAKRPSASGIDRVELAYARYLLETVPHRLAFAAINRWGEIGGLPFDEAAQFVAALDSVWHGAPDPLQARKTVSAKARHIRFHLHVRGTRVLRNQVGDRSRNIVYVLVSHHHLERAGAIARLKSATGALFTCFVHDTIPADHPALSRPAEAMRHRRRLATVADLADLIVVNSAATKGALAHCFADRRLPPILVAPLGVERRFCRIDRAAGDEPPYFVCVSTIEPKKNQILLLDVWKKLHATLGAETPRLLLIGRQKRIGRGTIQEIARSPELRGLVVKLDFLPDRAMADLVAGARAALLPSLAEGYGLAVAEALALGAPVLCSDLPALREVGGVVPDYLDPRAEAAWCDAVLDYARPESDRRGAQLARLSMWRTPRWDDHFSLVGPLLADRPRRGTSEPAEPRAGSSRVHAHA